MEPSVNFTSITAGPLVAPLRPSTQNRNNNSTHSSSTETGETRTWGELLRSSIALDSLSGTAHPDEGRVTAPMFRLGSFGKTTVRRLQTHPRDGHQAFWRYCLEPDRSPHQSPPSPSRRYRNMPRPVSFKCPEASEKRRTPLGSDWGCSPGLGGRPRYLPRRPPSGWDLTHKQAPR